MTGVSIAKKVSIKAAMICNNHGANKRINDNYVISKWRLFYNGVPVNKNSHDWICNRFLKDMSLGVI